jgi:tetratricopeptide (TPR) repeat protein
MIRLTDSFTGKELAVLKGHESEVYSAAFSPDGMRLASASADRTVRIWEVATGKQLAVLKGHEGEVYSVAFSPDGTRVASGSSDRTVRLWDSIPHRVRFSERQALLAVRPAAELAVDALWQQPVDAKSIADQLRGDASLGEQQRRAALNLLLQKSAQLHNHVNDLYASLIFTEDAMAALDADKSLRSGVRDRAIKIARAKGDKPLRLNSDSWRLVRSAEGTPESYAVGLRGAEAAVAAEPDNVTFLGTLGVADYRNGRFEEAFTTLTRCGELRRKHGSPSNPYDVAVIAMALFKIERVEEARATFQQLEEMMTDTKQRWMYDEEATAMFGECKQLLEGPDPQAEPLENADETED